MVRKKRATGPVPLRTARGAGRREAGRLVPRFDDVERAVDRDCDRDRELLDLVGDFRPLDRELEPPRVLLLLPDEDVLLLREPVGEDVRVAMPPT